MVRMLSSLVLVTATSLIPFCVAAEGSHCADVYNDATRNVDIYTKTLTEQGAIFNQHCETNGSIRQSSASLDLTIPVKAIKLGFSGGKDEAQSEMQDFCKRHQASLQRIDSMYRLSSSVVVDALRSFNQCRALETSAVNITHLATDSRSLVVRVDFNPKKANVTLNSVQYDEKIAECVSNAAGDSNEHVKFPMSPIIAIGPFSIACTRIATETTSSGKKFDRLELLVDTNQGPYSVVLPTEEMLGYDLANQNRAAATTAMQLQLALEGEIHQLKSEGEALRSKMANPQVRVFSIQQGSGLGPTSLGCSDNVQKYADSTCPAPNVRTSIYRSVPEHSGGACGYRTWQWTCVSYQ